MSSAGGAAERAIRDAPFTNLRSADKLIECQVNNTHGDPVKTGSLYETKKIYKTAAQDNKWWTQEILVRGKRVIVKVDGETVLDYTEPEGKTGTVKLGKGLFALQAHDPKSEVQFKNIKVRPLP